MINTRSAGAEVLSDVGYRTAGVRGGHPHPDRRGRPAPRRAVEASIAPLGTGTMTANGVTVAVSASRVPGHVKLDATIDGDRVAVEYAPADELTESVLHAATQALARLRAAHTNRTATAPARVTVTA